MNSLWYNFGDLRWGTAEPVFREIHYKERGLYQKFGSCELSDNLVLCQPQDQSIDIAAILVSRWTHGDQKKVQEVEEQQQAGGVCLRI